MEGWSSYALSDFLLFSPQTYFRQFALINEAAMPLPVLLHALAAVLVWLSVGRAFRYRRAITVCLAVLLVGSAWLFHWRSYATINWIAPWFAAGFAMQAAFLLFSGAAGSFKSDSPARAGTLLARGVAIACVVLYPLQAVVFGRPWREAELIGVSPDATALFTAAMIVLLKPPRRWLLLVLPIAWLVVGLLTLGTMGALEMWTLGALCLGLVAATIAGRKDRAARRSAPEPGD